MSGCLGCATESPDKKPDKSCLPNLDKDVQTYERFIKMATLPNVKVPIGEWIDLYSETGLAVGTKIIVQNIGSSPCYLVDSAAEPNILGTGYNIIQPSDKPNNFLTNSDAPEGAWAYSPLGTTLQVIEV